MTNDGRRLDLNFGTIRLVKPSEPTQPRKGPIHGIHARARTSRSKFQLVRGRHGGGLSGVIFMRIFGADRLRPLAPRREWGLVNDAHRPSDPDNAFNLDREIERD